jgi:hypothetical protein
VRLPGPANRGPVSKRNAKRGANHTRAGEFRQAGHRAYRGAARVTDYWFARIQRGSHSGRDAARSVFLGQEPKSTAPPYSPYISNGLRFRSDLVVG